MTKKQPPRPSKVHHKQNPFRPRTGMVADETTLLGRIDKRLLEMGKKRVDMLHAMGMVTAGTISSLGRRGFDSLRIETAQKMSAYLGVTVPYLMTGRDDGLITRAHAGTVRPGKPGDPPLDLDTPKSIVPVKSHHKVAAANGHAKTGSALHGNLDHAMQTLWSVAEPDVKALFIAKMSELVVASLKR